MKTLSNRTINYLLICFIFLSCSEPEENNSSGNSELRNTLYKNSLGGELMGSTAEYFYDFNSSIEASYHMYNGPRFGYEYDKYRQIFNDNPPAMSLKNFPDYLLSITPNSTELLKRNLIDTLLVNGETVSSEIGKIVEDSVQLFSTQFKNLTNLEWDLEADLDNMRYRLRSSDWIQSDTMLYYSDTFDVASYWAIVDTPLIEIGLMFVDSSEWRDTSYAFAKELPIILENNFVFEKTQMNSDSLVYRINTDCNDNNSYDYAETKLIDFNGDGDSVDVLIESPEVGSATDYNNDGDVDDILFEYLDRSNGVLDPAEVFYDANNDGLRDLNEAFVDRNCNDQWDDTEQVDAGNSQYDIAEEYRLSDLDEDGVLDTALFILGEKPNNLLVDWSDQNNPQLILEINVGDGIVDRWGQNYDNIIETVQYTDLKKKEIPDVDSLVTLYTKDIIGHILTDGAEEEDYFITKTDWNTSSSGNGERKYDYQLYTKDGHVNQLVYPYYFLPDGFYWSENQINNGFWHKDILEEEVYLYAYNGLLRDGEIVDTAYFDTTDIAIYYIEKSYLVDQSQITIPAAKIRFLDNDDGSYTCLRDNSIVSISSDCAGVDTTFSNSFRVTHLLTMTQMGSGVEYGQKTYTWFAKDYGVVKSEMFLRWSEHPIDISLSSGLGTPDSLGHIWVGYSRIELSEFESSGSENLFRQLVNPPKSLKLEEIGLLPDFNFDPFRKTAQSGMHTVNLKNN